nr:PcfJ domain-containing protein [uncultured Agathobaculum sp.]
MTTGEMLTRLPNVQPDLDELQRVIGRELPGKMFARRVDGEQAPFLPYTPPHWECVCTACGKQFAANRKDKLKDMTVCPECGAKVEPHRWTNRQGGKQTGAFLFYHLFRGAGREIWVRSWRVSQWLNFDGLEIAYEPVSIYYFDDGTAEKWKRGWWGWERLKTIQLDRWKPNTYSCACYPAFVGAISKKTIEGSCLEYSQLDRAMLQGFPVIEYIGFYLKNPSVEYLWKSHCIPLLEDYFLGHKGDVRRAVNLKAKTFKGLFRGADKQEMKIIPQLRAQEIVWFHRLYQAGVIRADQDGVDWARARRSFYHDIPGGDEKRLYRYIHRQAERCERSCANTLQDYSDYLDQIHRLGGGELWPHDLDEAHRRLSAREREMQDRGLNGMFRARRRLWQWAVWRHSGMLIRPVDSVNEITLEGERQNNCVAGYARRHAEGQTVIFVLRRADAPTQSWYTVELDPKTLTVRQCRGYQNESASVRVMFFADAWMQRLKNIRDQRRKSA